MGEAETIGRVRRPNTRQSIAEELRALGLQPGTLALVHASLSRLGWVCGGPVAVVQALLDVVGPAGTVVMPTQSGDYTDPALWQEPPVPPAWVPVIRETMPAYDPLLTPSRGMGAIAETFRGWPGTTAPSSSSPCARVCRRGGLHRVALDRRLDAEGTVDVFAAVRRGLAGCVIAVRERVVYPMQTLTNLLAALREGDYSLRSRRARRDDALGDVMREINALGETLSPAAARPQEALALLRAVMAEIDVAVFTFDDARRLRLVNRTAARNPVARGRRIRSWAARRTNSASPTVAGRRHPPHAHRGFPRPPGARWSLHRSSFREGGRPTSAPRPGRRERNLCARRNAPPGNGSSACSATRSTIR